jgi:hypothetical protein
MLMSEKEYGDFILEVAFKFMNGGARGNGGIALRAALKGDPAYTGLEMQITDPRYETRLYPAATGEQLTGALYLVYPPRVQMYLSGDWNEYRIEMWVPKVKATLNGVIIQDVDRYAHGPGQASRQGTGTRRRHARRPAAAISDSRISASRASSSCSGTRGLPCWTDRPFQSARTPRSRRNRVSASSVSA